MAMEDVERAVRAVDWKALGTDAESVVTALKGLLSVQTEDDGDRLYGDVLDAIGHNHSGRLYDAAGPAAAILADIAREASGWTRIATLEILTDCLNWVRSDQCYLQPDGTSRSVREALCDAVAGLEPLLLSAVNDQNAFSALRVSAAELLRAAHR